jgi:hypothetical protein
MRRNGPINPLKRADLGFGQVAAAVLNAAGAKKAGGGMFEPGDFLKYGEPEEQTATIEDVMAMLKNARVK